MQKGFVSFVDVKRAVTMEALLGRYELLESLTRKGANLTGPCPFCKGTSRRQFQVNLVKNAWYCFGCKAGGNVLDFVAKQEGVSIRTAALKLNSWFEGSWRKRANRPKRLQLRLWREPPLKPRRQRRRFCPPRTRPSPSH